MDASPYRFMYICNGTLYDIAKKLDFFISKIQLNSI